MWFMLCFSPVIVLGSLGVDRGLVGGSLGVGWARTQLTPNQPLINPLRFSYEGKRKVKGKKNISRTISTDKR